MVSYNDVTKLTFLYENKLHDKILEYIINLCGSNNILDIFILSNKKNSLKRRQV